MEYKEREQRGRAAGDPNRQWPAAIRHRERRLVSPQLKRQKTPFSSLSPCYCLIFERGKSRRERAISAEERGCAVYVCDQPTSSTHPDL